MSIQLRAAAVLLVLVLCVVAPLGAAPAGAPPAVPPEELARQLLQLSGGGDLGKQAMTQLIDVFRKSNPAVPDAFWDEFIASVDPRQLEEMVVPIYVEHLTVAEMTAAIEFYSSPAGRTLVEKLPVIMRESMAAGQAWGAKIGQDLVQRIEKYKGRNPDA